MKKTSFLLFILIYISLSSSFVINPYLFPGEKAAFVSKMDIVVNNQKYELYKLNESWILLVKNNLVVDSENEIRKVIEEYFKEKYGVNENDSREMEELLLLINKSRNDGDKFPKYEENTCKFVLGERYNKPSNWESLYNGDLYYFYAVATCSKLGSAIGCSDPNSIYPDINEFFTSSENNDVLMSEMLNIVKGLNESKNLSKDLDELESKFEEFKSNEEKLENSKWRVPIEPGSCDDCLGVCPPVLYNKTAIGQFENKILELKDKISPLNEMQNRIEELKRETIKRTTYKEGKELAKIYENNILKILKEWEEKEPYINKSVEKIKDNYTEENYVLLLNIASDLNKTLETYNYSNISKKIEMFEQLLNSTYDEAMKNLEDYNRVKKIKDKIEAYLYVMEKEGYLGVEETKSQKEDLDVLFNKRISKNALSEFEEEYNALFKEVKAKREAGRGLSFVGNIIRSIFSPFANGIIYAITTFRIENEYINNNIPLISGVISGLFLLSLSIVIGSVIYTIKPVIFGVVLHKSTYKFIYFSIIGIIGIVGLILGLVSIIPLTTGVSDAPLFELLSIMKNSPQVNIIVDKSSLENFEERKFCANQIEESFSNIGVNSTVYYKTEDECESKEGEVIERCSFDLTPQIVLVSSKEKSLKGSDIGFTRLYIKGDKKTFEDCSISSLIE